MHPLQIADRDLGVACGGSEIGMAKDGLKMSYIGAVVQHMRGHGMA